MLVFKIVLIGMLVVILMTLANYIVNKHLPPGL